MQQLPALRPEPGDHRVQRSDRQRNHQRERAEAVPEVLAIDDLSEGVAERSVAVVQPEDEEVRRDVEEAEEPELAAWRDQRVPSGEPANRRDQQREREEDELEHAGRTDQEVDAVDTELTMDAVPHEEQGGNQRIDDDDPLREP